MFQILPINYKKIIIIFLLIILITAISVFSYRYSSKLIDIYEFAQSSRNVYDFDSTNESEIKIPNAKPASNSTLKGVDVSHFQKYVNWKELQKEDIDFAFIKASEAEKIIDPLLEENYDNIKKTNIKYGFYHFFRPKYNSTRQAKNFIKATKEKTSYLPPVLDVEITENIAKDSIIKKVKVWIELVEKEFGCKPIIYSSHSFYNQYLQEDFNSAKYLKWIAAYDKKNLKGEIYGLILRQNTSKARLRGIKGYVDFDYFIGNKRKLRKISCKKK